MELVSKAIEFAVKVHDGMRRKKSELPYILHPLEVAVIVGTMTSDQNVIAAAVLHDVVEDANISIDEIEQKFGKRVKELVLSETEDIDMEEVYTNFNVQYATYQSALQAMSKVITNTLADYL